MSNEMRFGGTWICPHCQYRTPAEMGGDQLTHLRIEHGIEVPPQVRKTDAEIIQELEDKITLQTVLIDSLKVDRDAQAALVAKMKEFVKACNVAWHPDLTRKQLNDALYNLGDNAADLFLVLTPSLALQEFKEKCWKEGVKAALVYFLGSAPESEAHELQMLKASDSIMEELKMAGK